ncbi:MAG: phosphoesterase PA-phosphatase related [Blastococcus sp.]|nr:phosphoesterase PA-phosphatase related [Blastococcus sp.]
MNQLIVLIAQDLLYLLVLIAAGVWLTRDRRGKISLAAEAIVGLIIVGVGITLVSHLHSDPRPFVHDPQSAPLFPHPADNGFPSDHSAAAGLLTALVLRYKRWLGAVVAVGAVAIAWARVAAHVHHAQDVVTGLGVGLAAGAVAAWLVHLLIRRVEHQAGWRRAERTM